ncbi:hypothetical protein BC937DRAFT_90359 [Endogone sp. FLAS-F59071]|nr:hypothetical protein BC937DRAFT_90359 [Endogone sp. FLAS-F59071]|eukprot:RUS22105.1 hypothetical protein BC937DRAFT_90359 [Endogone sp. FLAS-F59071]
MLVKTVEDSITEPPGFHSPPPLHGEKAARAPSYNSLYAGFVHTACRNAQRFGIPAGAPECTGVSTVSPTRPIPQETFLCELNKCGALFTRSQDLEKHIRSWHFSEDPLAHYMPSFSRYHNSAETLNQRVPNNLSKTRDEPKLHRSSFSGDFLSQGCPPIGHGRIAKTRNETNAQLHAFRRVATDDDNSNSNNNDDNAGDDALETVVPVTSPNLIEARNANVGDEADLQHDFTLSTDSRDNFFFPPGFMLDSRKAPRMAAVTADEKPHSSGNEPTQHLPHDRKLCDDVFKRREHFMRHLRTIRKNERSFQCPMVGCTRCFARLEHSIHHIKLDHQQQSKDKTNASLTQNEQHTGHGCAGLVTDMVTLKAIVEDLQRTIMSQNSRIQTLEAESQVHYEAHPEKSTAIEGTLKDRLDTLEKDSKRLLESCQNHDTITTLRVQLASRDAEVRELEQTVSIMTTLTEQLKQKVAFRDAEIVGLQKAVDAEAAESENMVKDLEDARAEATILFNLKEQLIAEGQLQENMRDLAEKEMDKLRRVIAAKDTEIEKLRGTVVVIDRSISNDSKTISLGELAKQNAALVSNSKQYVKIKIPTSRKPKEALATPTPCVDDPLKVAKIQAQEAEKTTQTTVGQSRGQITKN